MQGSNTRPGTVIAGSNDGDPSNDFTVNSTGEVLSVCASASEIYTKFVKGYLVDSVNNPLFDSDEFPTGDADFTPVGIDELDLGNCSAACAVNPACCFDETKAGRTSSWHSRRPRKRSRTARKQPVGSM